jgi:hypothetical protein
MTTKERRTYLDGHIKDDGRLSLLGRSQTARQWGHGLGVSVALIAARLAFGETVRTALTAPIGTVTTDGQTELADKVDAAKRAIAAGVRR